jgi:hypothetical protein
MVFALLFGVSFWVAYRTHAIRSGILAAVWSALIASLIWVLAVLVVFYLFNGSAQQTQVFQAEGNFEDFARSGVKDFNTFVMEDFMGASFFHSLLIPLAAALVGAIGAAAGKGLGWLRKS